MILSAINVSDSQLWGSGMGFLTMGLLLAVELAIQRRGFARSDTDIDADEY